MRRFGLFVALLPALGCSSATSSSAPLRHAAIIQTQTSTDASGNYVRQMTFAVTDISGAPVPNGGIRMQVTGGSLSGSLVSGANGQGTMTWTILAADATAGHTYSLGFCALSPGSQNCQSDVGGPDAVHVSF